MTPHEPLVRACLEADIPSVTEIYAHYVLNSRHSFEQNPPDVSEMCRRWQAVVDRGLPWFVAEVGDVVSGYAYAGLFRQRPAYHFTVEESVYIAADAKRAGLGRALLTAVILHCESAGFRQMIAVIADDNAEGSIELHRALGFQDAGRLKAVGHKDGAWVDTIYMQRALGPGATQPPPD